LLGAPYLEIAGKIRPVQRRKVMALLAYLAIKGDPQRRESLAALLWPGSPAKLAHGSLRRTLSEATQILGRDWMVGNRDMVGLHPDLGLWLDVTEFQKRVVDCAKAIHDCHDRLVEAVSLYRDDFLTGFTLPDCPDFDEWQFFQAEALRQAFSTALQNLCRLDRQQGETEAALAHARRWLALDLLHEPAHRELMVLYAESGQQAAALRQYQVCADTLATELGIAPSEETTALYERIRVGSLSRSAREQAPGVATPLSALPRLEMAVPLEKANVIHNLPRQHTSFVGRVRELAEITRLLCDEPECRLLTLVGPGGVGKTRLALRAAENSLPAFPFGVYYVPLADIASPEFLDCAIADALGITVPDDPGDQGDWFFRHLHEKTMLLILDGFEHLLAGVDWLSELLVQASKLKLLITSRARLNLQEEWGLEVQGMRYPQPDEAADQDLETYSAVQLFVERARHATADFALTPENTPAVFQICHLVDGMPLGIELAAFWLRIMSCQEIAAQIKRNLDFLTTSLHNVPERHRSLRAVFENSWQLLSADERAVFSQLSVFRGGFHRRAAERVVGATLPILSALADKSLLRRDPGGRYQIHESLRQFAAEKLQDQTGESEQVRDRHCVYFGSFVQARHPERMRGREQKETFQAIVSEVDNLRTAWLWAIERGYMEVADKFIGAFSVLATVRGWLHEMIRLFDKAIVRLRPVFAAGDPAQPAPSRQTTLLFGQLLTMQASFCRHVGLLERAQALCEEGLEALAGVGLDDDVARIHADAKFGLGLILHQQGNYANAVPFYQEALNYTERSGNAYEVASVLVSYGLNAFHLGQYPQAEGLLQRSITILVEIGENWRRAFAMHTLGGLIYAQVQGDTDRAERLVSESLRISQELDDRLGTGFALQHLGTVALLAGNHAQARQLYQESLALARQTDSRMMKLASLNGLGAVATSLEEFSDARQWYEESVATSERVSLGKQAPEAFIGLGNVACAVGEYDQARRYYRQALQTRIRSAGETLEAIAGVADLLSKTGEPAAAAELAALAAHHPSSMRLSRVRGEELCLELAGLLPPAAMVAAKERGRGMHLETTAAGLVSRLGG
jgi:predicted ATPase/DNA-binding SARP family transcriptional activator/tetratricopeptide (TPR) repeat protein